MSNFNNDRSAARAGGYDVIAAADDEEDDGDGDVCRGHSESEARNQTGRIGYKRGFQKAKQIVRIFSFRKNGEEEKKEKKKREAVVMESNHRNNRGKRMIGCCLCLMQPRTYESSAVGMPDCDDVNNQIDIDFVRYETVKNLLESNQFYDKDCNTHVSFVSLHPD